MLDVHLFGHARICVDGAAIKFAKRRATMALLAYLILHRAKPVSRDLLAYTLFPDLDEEAASAELRRYLYLAQKKLPSNSIPWIIADSETVRWNESAPVTIDVVEFERLVAASKTVRAALELYEGDLLPEVYEDWVLAERERLRALYLNAMVSLIVRARSERDYATAIGHAQRLLALEPWREDVLRHLVSARYEMGDAAGALAEYDRFAHAAAKELAVEPMAETRALREAIVSGTPLPTSLDRATDGHHARPEGFPFQGRQKDLERLQHAWQRAARGSGGIAAIEGEPGIGKSRLAAEFALIVESEGGRLLAGTTAFPEKAPYQCAIEVLRAALPFLDGLPQTALRRSILSQLLPEMREREPGLPEPPPVERGHDQTRLFDAIGSAITALARTRPLCIILEDLHWAGRATLELLRSLARRASNSTVLIVVTFRDDETPPDHPLRALLRDLADERLATSVPLTRLTLDDVASLVAHLPERAERPLDARALFATTEGNPLFLSLAIHESLETTTSEAAALSVEDIIERRLDRLSPEAHRLAQVAAVCGESFDVDIVFSASGSRDAQALGAVQELLERHIIREAAAASGFNYVFAHHLISATLYAGIDPQERRSRHARVARSIERVQSDRLDGVASEIARHYDAAGEHADAARWYASSARVAAAIFAHDEAVRFATLAIEKSSDHAEIVDMLLTREQANARLGRDMERLADLDRLDEMALDDAIRCEVLRRRVELLHSLDDRDAERRAIAALKTIAVRKDDRHWQGVGDCAEAWLEISIGRYSQAQGLALSALAHLDAAGSPAEKIDCLSALVEVNVTLGRQSDAQLFLERAQVIATETADGRALGAALMQAVAAAISQQQFDRVLKFGNQAVALYRSLGDRIGEARAQVSVAAASVRQSRWADARVANLSAAQTFELMGDLRGLARVLMNLGMLHGRCGDFEGGRHYIVLAREHQIRLGDDRALTASLLNESFLALWQGRVPEAKKLARRALEIATRMDHASYRAAALANLGAAERDGEQLAQGIVHMRDGLGIQLELGRLPDAVSDLADAALAYAMASDLKSAMGHVERILAIDRSWAEAAIFPPYPPWVAARILHAVGDSRAAEILAWAKRLSETYAASIDVPELRAHFEALPFVHEISRADQNGEWPAFAPGASARRHARRTGR